MLMFGVSVGGLAQTPAIPAPNERAMDANLRFLASDLLEASTPEIDDVVRLKDRYGRV